MRRRTLGPIRSRTRCSSRRPPRSTAHRASPRICPHIACGAPSSMAPSWAACTCHKRMQKLPCLEALVDRARRSEVDLLIGAFNTGNNVLDKDPKGTQVHRTGDSALIAAGHIDVWRSLHPGDSGVLVVQVVPVAYRAVPAHPMRCEEHECGDAAHPLEGTWKCGHAAAMVCALPARQVAMNLPPDRRSPLVARRATPVEDRVHLYPPCSLSIPESLGKVGRHTRASLPGRLGTLRCSLTADPVYGRSFESKNPIVLFLRHTVGARLHLIHHRDDRRGPLVRRVAVLCAIAS